MNQDNAKLSPNTGKLKELADYFEKGKTFTEELIRENERLRMRILRQEKEKMDLLAKMDPEREKALQDENKRLKSKIDMLEARFDEIEKENMDFANRYLEVQSQNDNLLNLYVSSYQLHSTLVPDEVITVICEIILNLVGAEQYFICLMEENKPYPVVVAGEGPEGPLERKAMTSIDPVLQMVLGDGQPYYRSNGASTVSHLACTPLKVKDRVIGAISITKLLDHKKEGLTSIDHEILDLLADHAATALVSSNLYNRTERKLRTVEAFIDMLKLDANTMDEKGPK